MWLKYIQNYVILRIKKPGYYHDVFPRYWIKHRQNGNKKNIIRLSNLHNLKSQYFKI